MSSIQSKCHTAISAINNLIAELNEENKKTTDDDVKRRIHEQKQMLSRMVTYIDGVAPMRYWYNSYSGRAEESREGSVGRRPDYIEITKEAYDKIIGNKSITDAIAKAGMVGKEKKT